MYVHLVRQIYALLIVRMTTTLRTTTRLQRVANWLTGGAMILAILLACAIGYGSYYLSAHLIEELPPLGHLLILDAMVVTAAVFWLWSLVLDVQRNDTFDVRAVLTLPVTPWLVVLLNYLVSLVSFIMFLFPPALYGYIIGLHVRYDAPLMGMLVPVTLFVLGLGGWVYYLRGLIANYMENKRRRAVLLTVLPIGFVILSQLPFLMITIAGDNLDAYLLAAFEDPRVTTVIQVVNVLFPPAWMPYAVYAAKEGWWLQSMAACFGVGLLWVLSLRLAYRATLHYYQGETTFNVRSKRGKVQPRQYATLRRVPGLDDITAGLVWSTFLNMSRHPQVRMMLLMPLVLSLIFLFSATVQQQRLEQQVPPDMPGEMARLQEFELAPFLFILLPFINLGVVMFNQFGFDSNGFRSLMLLPLDKRRILFARNLSFVPFLIILCIAFVAPAIYMTGASVERSVIALFQTFQIYLLFCTVGNFLSVLSPYRVGRNSMKGAGNRPMLMLLGLLAVVLVLTMAVPSFVCLQIDTWLEANPTWGAYPVGLGLSCLLILLSLPVYLIALRYAARLFERREQRILARLVRETA